MVDSVEKRAGQPKKKLPAYPLAFVLYHPYVYLLGRHFARRFLYCVA